MQCLLINQICPECLEKFFGILIGPPDSSFLCPHCGRENHPSCYEPFHLSAARKSNVDELIPVSVDYDD